MLAAPADDPLVATLARALEDLGASVVLVGLNTAGADERSHEAQLRAAMCALPSADGGGVIVGGFSLGARIAAGLLGGGLRRPGMSEPPAPRGLLCFGYPFHPATGPKRGVGLEALSRVTLPTCIIQGTRDNHGSVADVRSYRLPASVEMVWLEDGNHRFLPRVRSGLTFEQHVHTAAAAAYAFMGRV